MEHQPYQARFAAAVARISLSWVFLWAFVRTWGLDRQWEQLSVVKRFPVLK